MVSNSLVSRKFPPRMFSIFSFSMRDGTVLVSQIDQLKIFSCLKNCLKMKDGKSTT